MIFHELIINTNSLGYEIVTGVLLKAGISSFAIEDRADLDIILTNKSIPVDYIEEGLLEDSGGIVRIKVYLAENEQGRLALEEIRTGIEQLKKESEFDLGSLEFIENKVNESDWQDN